MFEKLGKFEIKRLLGQGAMGEVYLGIDPAIGREVAIKTILAAATQAAEAKQRFEREAKAAGALNHPNLVTIYEFGEDQDVLFIAMEYVRGQDLEEMFREQSLSRSESLEVLAQVCDGLSFAHRNGIVHRDIKPSNIRVTRDGRRLHAKVMDFGVARMSNSDMTATGMVMGTVSYMAPEYIRTGKPDPRSDLFAVGVMLYESLSGRKPFAGDTTPTILYKIVNEAPEPLDPQSITGISPGIRSVLDCALVKDPNQRYQTADDFAKALRAAKDPTWQGSLEEGTTVLRSAPQAPPPVQPSAPTAQVPSSAPTSAPTLLQPALSAPTVAVSAGSAAAPAPAAAPGRRSGALVAALVAGALVLAGGGAFAFMKWRGPRPPQEAQAATMDTSGAAITPMAPGTLPLQGQTGARTATPAGQGNAGPVGAQQVAGGQAGLPGQAAAPQVQGPQTQPQTAPPPREQPKGAERFTQENLETLQVPERKSLGNITLSEAIGLADKDPRRAIEGFRQAIAANPNNVNAYAWLVAVLYEQRMYREIPPVFARARRNGIGRQQMLGNIRFRMAMQRDSMNHNIPQGDE